MYSYHKNYCSIQALLNKLLAILKIHANFHLLILAEIIPIYFLTSLF